MDYFNLTKKLTLSYDELNVLLNILVVSQSSDIDEKEISNVIKEVQNHELSNFTVKSNFYRSLCESSFVTNYNQKSILNNISQQSRKARLNGVINLCDITMNPFDNINHEMKHLGRLLSILYSRVEKTCQVSTRKPSLIPSVLENPVSNPKSAKKSRNIAKSSNVVSYILGNEDQYGLEQSDCAYISYDFESQHETTRGVRDRTGYKSSSKLKKLEDCASTIISPIQDTQNKTHESFLLHPESVSCTSMKNAVLEPVIKKEHKISPVRNENKQFISFVSKNSAIKETPEYDVNSFLDTNTLTRINQETCDIPDNLTVKSKQLKKKRTNLNKIERKIILRDYKKKNKFSLPKSKKLIRRQPTSNPNVTSQEGAKKLSEAVVKPNIKRLSSPKPVASKKQAKSTKAKNNDNNKLYKKINNFGKENTTPIQETNQKFELKKKKCSRRLLDSPDNRVSIHVSPSL